MIAKIIQLCYGNWFVLTKNGALYGVGNNSQGMLGFGCRAGESCTLTRCMKANTVPPDPALALYGLFSERCGSPMERVRLVEGCSSSSSLAIDEDGCLWLAGVTCYGTSRYFFAVPFEEPIVAAGLNADTLVFATQSGRLFGRGGGAGGVLGFLPHNQPNDVLCELNYFGAVEGPEAPPNNKVVSVRLFRQYTVALLADGRLYGWGTHLGADSKFRAPQLLNDKDTRFQFICRGSLYTFGALSTEGELWYWGFITGPSGEDQHVVEKPTLFPSAHRWSPCDTWFPHLLERDSRRLYSVTFHPITESLVNLD